jgi:hypothetical protein
VVLIVCSSFAALFFFVDCLMKCFYTARYLALKFGTNSNVLIYGSPLL